MSEARLQNIQGFQRNAGLYHAKLSAVNTATKGVVTLFYLCCILSLFSVIPSSKKKISPDEVAVFHVTGLNEW